MGFTLDFTHGPDAFFNSVGNLPNEVMGTLDSGISNAVDTVTGGIGDVAGAAGGALGGVLDKLGMPLMLLGGGLLVFMLIKK
jgi:hypothetical protein